MKKTSIFLTLLFIISVFSNTEVYSQTKGKYKKRTSIEYSKSFGIKGAVEWLYRRRMDTKTGEINSALITKSRNEISKSKQLKGTKGTGKQLHWHEIGPDNVGGRTKTILIDKTNPNKMFAGAVAGGLWVSDNAGVTWTKVQNNEFSHLSVTYIVQDSEGSIYFGTGESSSMSFFANNSTNATPQFPGGGIWKSINGGETFENLLSTNGIEFQFVNKMAVTSNDIIYAATQGGLFVSEDKGDNWNVAKSGFGDDMSSQMFDVDIASDDFVIVSSSNWAGGGSSYIYYKKAGDDNFTKSNGKSGKSIATAGLNRLEFAIAPSDPNYIYCQASNSGSGSLNAIYLSKDQAKTWDTISPVNSLEFNTLGKQGSFDNVIAVLPNNRDKIIAGGLDLYFGKATDDGVFNWGGSKISDWLAMYGSIYFDPGFSSYVHADQHFITFHPTDPNIFFVGCDGGIFKGVIDDNDNVKFKAMNKEYNVTQYYSAAQSASGKEFIGGTQDNGCTYISLDNHPLQKHNAILLNGGDGAKTEFSMLNSSVTFLTSYYGSLTRNWVPEQGFGQSKDFYSAYINTKKNGKAFTEASFQTPISLFESFNDTNSTEFIVFRADTTYEHGLIGYDTIKVESKINGKEIVYAVKDSDGTIEKGVEIEIQDPYQSFLIVGLHKGIYGTRNPLDLSDVSTWSHVGLKDGLDLGTIENIEFTANGNTIYYSNTVGDLFKTTNLLQARDTISLPKLTITKIKENGSFSGYINNITTDPSDTNNLIVLLSGYANYPHIMYSSDGGNSFSPKQGTGLPEGIPIYDALIHYRGSDTVFVGTDFGLYTTYNFNDANGPDWFLQEGLENVPVFNIKQQVFPNSCKHGIKNQGDIVIGTHGRGIFYSQSMATDSTFKDFVCPSISDIKPIVSANEINNLKVYPNPNNGEIANINYTIDNNTDIVISLTNILGQTVKKFELDKQIKGNYSYILPVSNLSGGTYIISVKTNNSIKNSKLIINNSLENLTWFIQY